MMTLTDPRPLASLVLGDLVAEVDGVALAEPRAVVAPLGPIGRGVTSLPTEGVRLTPLAAGTVEFVLYADRDDMVRLVDGDAEQPAAEPVAEPVAEPTPEPAPQSWSIPISDGVTVPAGITTAAPYSKARFNPRGLTATQCYVLVRAMSNGGAVAAHGSCMNALVKRGLASWVPEWESRSSEKLRGRLTRRGVGVAQDAGTQRKADALPSWQRPL